MATHSSILAWRTDRGIWWSPVYGLTKSWTLSDSHTHTHTHTFINKIECYKNTHEILIIFWYFICMGLVSLLLSFPGGLTGKESSCNAGDLGSIPGFGWSHGEGNSYPLQYSRLENSMYNPWGRKKSDTTEQLLFSHCY